jgi:uncharacterized cysteine cluster protein YcgN (CxxCxxCC family)
MPRNESAKQLKRQGSIADPGMKSDIAGDKEPFWKTTALDDMSTDEWESLCDGCGQCCLIKLEDEDTGQIAVTRLACKLLDLGTCQCSNYAARQDHVNDCVKLTPDDVRRITWLPETCAYRLVAEHKDLSWWHPLVSGTEMTVFEAGIAIRGSAIREKKVRVDRYPSHIVGWLKP